MLKQPFGDQKTLSIQLVVELAWQIAKDKKKKIIQKIIEQDNWGFTLIRPIHGAWHFCRPPVAFTGWSFSCGPTVKGQVYG